MPSVIFQRPTRRQILIGSATLAGAALPGWAEAQSSGVLRIGMTAADIPQMTGSPDNGFEGYRFCGYTIFDALCIGTYPRPRRRRTSSLASPRAGLWTKATRPN